MAPNTRVRSSNEVSNDNFLFFIQTEHNAAISHIQKKRTSWEVVRCNKLNRRLIHDTISSNIMVPTTRVRSSNEESDDNSLSFIQTEHNAAIRHVQNS
ncbi:hypothetical protein V1511DRAFT_510319 [Dipodascopsis uninucleata]